MRQGAAASRAVTGVREWLATLDAAFPSRSTRPSVAVFDTRVDKVRHLPGSAAKRAARTLRAQGFPVVDRTSFFVGDVQGARVSRRAGACAGVGFRAACAHRRGGRVTPAADALLP